MFPKSGLRKPAMLCAAALLRNRSPRRTVFTANSSSSDIHLHDIATRAYADGFSHHLARVFLSNKTIFVSEDGWLICRAASRPLRVGMPISNRIKSATKSKNSADAGSSETAHYGRNSETVLHIPRTAIAFRTPPKRPCIFRPLADRGRNRPAD